MKRKWKIAVLALALLVVAGLSYSGAHYQDVCQVSGESGSILCAGLVEHYELNELSDSPRFGASQSFLQEAPGIDVARFDSGSGYYVADFDGSPSKWLWANAPAPGDSFSIVLRVRIKTLPASGAVKYVLSWYNGAFYGPTLYFYNNAGTGQLCYKVYEAEESNTGRTVCQSATANAWHFVAIGASQYHDGKSNIWISVDNVARTTSSVNYWQLGGPSYLRIGGLADSGPASTSFTSAGVTEGTDMYLSKLDLFTRPISTAEQTLLYATGPAPSQALAFPYDTN